MPYSTFSFDQLQPILGLDIRERAGVFSEVAEFAPPLEFRQELLETILPLALANNTEKARSELIIAPVLLELWKLEKHKISLFSGMEFNVDDEKGLKGVCDFIISLSTQQLFLEAPVVTLVEAKKENLIQGMPQCIAEMRAAQIFNSQRKHAIKTIFGVVTTGTIWRFLQLEENTVLADLDEYHIKELDRIMGILHFMCNRA